MWMEDTWGSQWKGLGQANAERSLSEDGSLWGQIVREGLATAK